MRCGVRKSKSFLSQAEAEHWGRTEEDRLFRRFQRQQIAREAGAASIVPQRVLDAMKATDYTGDELATSGIPYEASCGVYFLIHKGEVVYVGQSIDLLGRISKHRREGKVFDAFNFIPCERGRALALEAQYITALLPALNTSFGVRAESESAAGGSDWRQ
jgi:hypothetical protein